MRAVTGSRISTSTIHCIFYPWGGKNNRDPCIIHLNIATCKFTLVLKKPAMFQMGGCNMCRSFFRSPEPDRSLGLSSLALGQWLGLRQVAVTASSFKGPTPAKSKRRSKTWVVQLDLGPPLGLKGPPEQWGRRFNIWRSGGIEFPFDSSRLEFYI